ncbi:MAG: hypothetical protein ACOCWZ_10125 [Spirochaetota bacterium]
MKYRIILSGALLVFCSFMIACSGNPVEAGATELTITTEFEKDRAVFHMRINAGFVNKSTDVVVTGYAGTLNIINDESGKALFSFPVRVERLMPMESVEVVLNKTGSEKEFRPLFDLMAIDMDQVIKSGEAGPIIINEAYVKIEDQTYSKVPVVTYLEETTNEDK